MYVELIPLAVPVQLLSSELNGMQSRLTILRFSSLLLLAIAISNCQPLAAAQLIGKPGEDVVALINTMKPGDELLLYPGIYKSTRYNEIKNKHGNKDAWFTIRGVGKVVIQNECIENTINLNGCSFFRFYNLEITGPKGGAAFKWLGANSDMIVEDCYLHHLGGQAINCSNVDKMTRLRVSHCHISHTGGHGEGFYLGHQDGSGSVFDSLFECNLIHDLGGKVGSGFEGDGFDVNPGCQGNTVRHNAIYRSIGPGIVVENEKAGPPNIVEGNMVWNCIDDANIQIRGFTILKDNVVMGGKNQYAIAKGAPGVTDANNVVWDAKQISHEEMLKRAMTMIEQRWQAQQKAAGVLVVQPLPGTDGKPVHLATTPASGTAEGEAAPPPPAFKPEAVAQARKLTIGRILERIKSHEALVLSLLVDTEPQQVTLVGGDFDNGLQVKLLYGSKKNLPWATIEPGTLAEILYQLTDAGQDDSDIGGQDLILSAVCNTVAGRSMVVAEQLEKLRAFDPALLERYKEQMAALKE